MKRAHRPAVQSGVSTRDGKGGKACRSSSFEALESRVLLSGNVLASVVRGSLNVRGDAAANVIVMDQTGLNADQVRITAATGTTVNGQADPIVLSGITRGVGIRMGAGADSLTLRDITLPGNAAIDMQAGADTLVLTGVQVQGKSNIVTGSGSDLLTVDDSVFNGAARFDTGGGADSVQIDTHGDALGSPTLFEGSAVFSLGAGNDAMQLGVAGQLGNRAIFAASASIDGGEGHDSLQDRNGATYLGKLRIKDFEVHTSAPDITAPTVSSTDPADLATQVAINRKIAATFSEAMNPLTIVAANVTVATPDQVPVSGTVSYVGTTMTFTPANPLPANTTFTGTITTGAEDLAGNPLAGNYVWTFTTGSTADVVAPTVTSTNPADLQANVPLNKSVAATFDESIDPLTVTASNYAVTGPGGAAVGGTVTYDSQNKTALFTPTANFVAGATYTATIRGGNNGVKDLAGNALASDKVWTFTTGAQVAQPTIDLRSAGAFAIMATASITGSGPNQINGDIGLNPGTSQGIPPSDVNGNIHINDQAAKTARADLLHAYDDAVSRTVTSATLPGNMGGLTFAPGLYTNSTSVLIQGAGSANNVTLDAQGDPNAVFIFKMGSTLTTGPGAQVILAGGAKASNVFWQVGTSATLNTTTIFKGTILAAVTITVNTGSDVVGRLLGGAKSDGSVTVNASTVTIPVG